MVTKKSSVGKKVTVGGVALASVGVALGAYLLYGSKSASKNRKKVRSWALKAKGEVLEKVENLKEVSEDKYKNIVGSVMKKYDKFRDTYGEEVSALTKELLSHWKKLQKNNRPSSRAQNKKTREVSKSR